MASTFDDFCALPIGTLGSHKRLLLTSDSPIVSPASRAEVTLIKLKGKLIKRLHRTWWSRPLLPRRSIFSRLNASGWTSFGKALTFSPAYTTACGPTQTNSAMQQANRSAGSSGKRCFRQSLMLTANFVVTQLALLLQSGIVITKREVSSRCGLLRALWSF